MRSGMWRRDDRGGRSLLFTEMKAEKSSSEAYRVSNVLEKEGG